RTAVDCDMRDARRNKHVVTRMSLVAVLQAITRPQLHLLATQKVERCLVPFVDVRLCALTGWKAHHSEPQHTLAGGFGADAWRVVRALHSLVSGGAPQHAALSVPIASKCRLRSSREHFDHRGLIYRWASPPVTASPRMHTEVLKRAPKSSE